MKIIYSSRQSGKTTKAVKLCVKHDAYLVCCSARRANEVFHEYKNKYPEFRYPIIFDDILNGKMSGSYIRKIVVDDVDEILFRIANGLEILGITLTKYNKKLEIKK